MVYTKNTSNILYPKCNFLIFMKKQIKPPQYQCLLVLLCSMSDSGLVDFDPIYRMMLMLKTPIKSF